MKEKYKNVLMEVQLAVNPKISSPQLYFDIFEFTELIPGKYFRERSLEKNKSDLKIILRLYSKI
jgi:hypothetical protein